MIHLSRNYSEARAAFLRLAASNQYLVKNHLLSGYKGQEGEALFCDTALVGNPEAKRCLIISSGVHGIEGFCGSAVQCRLMQSGLLSTMPKDIKILFVHAVNPYGFSHFYRVNEENIDLNRNFLDFRQKRQKDEDISSLYERVFPLRWQGTALDTILRAVDDYAVDAGIEKFQSDLTRGQYHYPSSPYFGGHKATWSRRLWQKICANLAKDTRFVSHLDIHTGLGATGDCEVIYTAAPNDEPVRLAKAWYGEGNINLPGSADSISAAIQGTLGSHIAKYPMTSLSVALEFGTQAIPQVTQALVESNWLFHNSGCPLPLRAAIQQKMREAFMVETESWSKDVWRHSENYVNLSLKGLVSMQESTEISGAL